MAYQLIVEKLYGRVSGNLYHYKRRIYSGNRNTYSKYIFKINSKFKVQNSKFKILSSKSILITIF